MRVVYTAPNRGHHYRYAAILKAAGYLHAFVSGVSRLNPYAKAPELGEQLHRVDILQTLYLASLKLRVPFKLARRIAYLSKIEQDAACHRFVKDADIFMFYNGSGLDTCRVAKKHGVICIVEAVNSHVEYQEAILEQESKSLNVPFKASPLIEQKRRLLEYEEADYILLPSAFVKRSFIAKGFSESKLLKVPFGFNKATGGKQISKSASDGSFTVLFVGSICVRKGVRYLIEAFNNLQHPKKKLLIVGPDVNDGAISNVSLNADIVFTGPLKGEQLENAYQTADVFCLPSIEEGLALVLGEALSFGLPIIATCNTGADDIITNHVEGFIVPIRDAAAIAHKLQLLANTPGLLQQMKTNSYNSSKQLGGWDETGKKLVETLSNLIHQKEAVQ